ncbi:MAG: NTP transferase domain-containing protein [Sphingobacteriaceae bacterium]|nr:NTP transferase domain-containing protein [Sphingobacteriaceae bacterium]
MGECKFLLKTPSGISFLENQIRAALTCNLDKIIIVTSTLHSEEIRKIIDVHNTKRIQMVINENNKSERFYSIQCGLKALKKFNYCFIHNTDCPELNPNTFFVLHSLKHTADSIIPVYSDKGGHPVLINQKMMKLLLKAPSNSRLDVELKKSISKRVNVNDSCIHLDIDTPEDYEHYILNN